MTDTNQGEAQIAIENDSQSQVVIDAGTLEFNADDLTATGLLIPFGVKARSNLGEFTFAPGDVVLPSDYTGMSLNVEHKREDVVGAFSKVWEQEEGVFATFKYSTSEAGRKAFEEGKNGSRKNLSAEVAKVRIRDGKALPGAILFAAAQVERPAFEGATLLAAEDTPEETEALVPSLSPEALAIIAAIREELAKNSPAEPVAEVTEPPVLPAEESNNTDEEPLMATENEAGSVPATLLAGATANKKNEDIELGTVFASIHAVKNSVSGQAADAETLLAALSDIKVNTTGGLTTAASGVIQPAWVGKLWQGRRVARKYIDLGTHLYGGIQLGGRKGFTIDQGTALVQHWNGNKSDVPSGTASTSTKASSLLKYAYGADVAREWYDLEGGADVLQAFFEGVVDSYAELTDEDALKAIIAAALTNSVAGDKLQVPGTYPTEYPEAMGILIDAIEAVQDAKDSPSFAIVNPAAWRQLLFTPKDLVPEFVNFAVNIADGTGLVDGKVNVVKAADEYFTGLDPLEPAVVAGAKKAIEFREQGTTPISVDALDIAKGGIDKAVFGYLETFVVRPESFVAFGTDAA